MIVDTSLPIRYFGAQKNRLIEAYLLSANTIFFGLEIIRIFLCYVLLTKSLKYTVKKIPFLTGSLTFNTLTSLRKYDLEVPQSQTTFRPMTL